jgi:hypothetical protein
MTSVPGIRRAAESAGDPDGARIEEARGPERQQVHEAGAEGRRDEARVIQLGERRAPVGADGEGLGQAEADAERGIVRRRVVAVT